MNHKTVATTTNPVAAPAIARVPGVIAFEKRFRLLLNFEKIDIRLRLKRLMTLALKIQNMEFTTLLYC